MIINAGDTTYGPGDTSSTSGSAKDHPAYKGVPTFWLNDRTVIIAETQADLEAILARLSLLSKKPLSELTVLDVTRYLLDPSGNNNTDIVQRGGFNVTEMRFNSGQLGSTQEFNDLHYFGPKLPHFPPGSGTYLSSQFDTKSTDLAKSMGLGGLIGSARALYQSNYGKSQLSGISNSELNDKTLELLQKLFGQTDGFNQGHLNILKMMGLVTGTTKDPISKWTLSDNGKQLLPCFNGEENTFIPSMNLLGLSAKLRGQAGGVSLYFSGDGYSNGFTSANVEKDAKEILAGMGLDKTALPSNLDIKDDAIKALNFLFGLGADNTKFTTAQLNTAIAMGLVKYNAGSKTVELTNIGGIYLKDKEKPPVTTTNPPVNTDPLASLTGQQKLARGFQILTRAWFDVFDIGAGGYEGDDDYHISLRDIQWLSGMTGPDDVGWNRKVDTAWDQLPKEQRQGVINLAKYLMKYIQENPDAWKELAGDDNVFSMDEMRQFCRTHNSGGLEFDPSGVYTG